MYVCVCHAFTDRDVSIHAERDACTVSALYRSLGVTPTCGKCVPLVRQLMRQAVELPEPALAPG
jgi:bacterioferritin-associated ferredoxin